MWARVDKQEILSVALSFHYIHWFSTFFFLLLLFEYPQILIPIPSFTNKGIHTLVRIKGRTEAGEFIAWVCYRLSDQEDQGNEAPYRQRHNLVFKTWPMRDSSHTIIFWRDHAAGHRQFRRFPECPDTNFLLTVSEDPSWKAMMDLLVNKEGLVGNMKKKKSVGCCEN